jgi:glycine/D-amino acid oxidase-like deaminating enzyme
VSRIAIAGAGAFGLAAALALARRGHSVLVADPGPVPHPDASSTDTSKVVRMDYGSDAFYTDLAARAIEGWRAWNALWGEDVYRETGILLLTHGSWDETGFERRSYELLRSRGVPVERLDGAEIASRFPALRGSPYRDGYLNPRGGWVASAKAVALLAAEASAAGVEIVRGRIARVERGADGPALRLDSDEIVRADAVVVAAGAWTPWLVPETRGFLRATGQPVVHFAPADPTPFDGSRCPVWCGGIADTGWYGFPVGPTGTVKIGHHGPGRPFVAGDRLAVTEAERERTERFVRTSLPALAGSPVVTTRLCLYCDSPDGDFLIAPVPGPPGLFVAAGGSGHGFKFAPVLGPVVADVVEGKPSVEAERFRWRAGEGEFREQARHR